MPTRTPWNPVTGNVITEARLDTLPRGWIGYAEVTANQTVSTGTETDLTGLSVTVDVDTNRRIRVTGQGIFNRSVADGTSIARLKEGATELGRFSQHSPSAATEFDLGSGAAILTPTAGSHTYKATLQRVTGTGNAVLAAAVGSPAFILVEDLGAAS